MSSAPTVPKVDPQVICGPLHNENKNAFDWSWQGPLAFGCHHFIVVVDSHTSQNLQTLHKHKHNVIRVRWSSQLHHCTMVSPYVLRLASVDSLSQCIIWDIGQATPISEFSLGGKSLVDIQWLTTNDSCRDLIAVMLAPSTMTLWNTDTGTRISRLTFFETISNFTFNPFQTEQLILLSPECFIFVNDFNPLRNPTGGGKKLYMNIPPNQQIGGGGRGWSHEAPRRLLSGDNVKNEDTLTLVDCLQISFSPAVRHHLFLLYPREILIIDAEIMQAVGSIFLERNATPFVNFRLCQQRDALYCLHENGSITLRIRSPIEFPKNTILSPADFREYVDVSYDLHCQSEPFRISKSCVPYCLALCPTSELQAAILTSDGRVMFWHVMFEKVGLFGERLEEGSKGTYPLTLISALPNTNGDLEVDGSTLGMDSGRLSLAYSIAPHWFVPPEGPQMYSLLSAHFMLTNIYYGISSTPTTIRMCPPVTTKNWIYYQPLVAVGNSGGAVQIFNIGTRQLHRELTVHTCPVKGIEWVNHDKLLSYGYPPANNTGLVRNELAVTFLDTGRVVPLKKNETGYSMPITAVRVSPHKNYFFVNYKDMAPEVWDLRTLKLLRTLCAKPSVFPAIEWANTSAFPSFVSRVRSQAVSPENQSGDLELSQFKQESKVYQLPEREVLSLLDTTANIHHVTVDRSGFQLGPKKSGPTAMNHPLAMAWKAEIVVVGDIDGALLIWDVKGVEIKNIDTPRSVIRKIKFGPGKGNKRFLVLYSNRLDIRDIKEGMLSQFKWSKDELSTLEVDWASSDKPICLMSDGTVRVFDIKMSSCSSCHGYDEYREPVFSPYSTLPQCTFRLKSILQHQPWSVEYNLDYTELDTFDPIERGLAVLIQTIPNGFRQEFLKTTLGTPYRCLLTAQLFGDEREIQFWLIAMYYIIRAKERCQDPLYRVYMDSSVNSKTPCTDIIRPDSHASTSISTSLRHSLDDLLQDETEDSEVRLKQLETMIQEANQKTWSLTPPLDLVHDLFIDQDIYQHYQLHRVLCHDSRRHTTSQTRRCAETLLLLGQADRAVQLLLETDTNNTEYYSDALKACLAATIRSSGASQSTIKLVATNLIADSKLMEGVQLLCLIDKGLDACRYLQTYNEWYNSVWLAKSTLNEKEMAEVFLRWTDALTSTAINQKNKALQVYLSLGQFLKVIESLYSMRHFDQAAVFTESCLEYGVISRNKETAPLIEAVFLEYARLLESLGLTRGMRYYCNLAGENGMQLLEEHFSPHKSK